MRESTNLESIFSRKTLVAVSTRKRLDRQVNSLMSLQIMISVKGLRALIASEWSVVLRVGGLMPIHVVHLSGMPVVKMRHHADGHTAHRVAGEDCCTSHAMIAGWPILLLLGILWLRLVVEGRYGALLVDRRHLAQSTAAHRALRDRRRPGRVGLM